MLISRLYAAPGREAELETRVLKSVEFVRKAEPTTVIRAYRSKKEPSVFVFYEVFSSQAAYEEHLNVTNPARVKEMGPTPDGLFLRPPEIEAFTTLRN
jgi:quinol monooxygenase YgiN